MFINVIVYLSKCMAIRFIDYVVKMSCLFPIFLLYKKLFFFVRLGLTVNGNFLEISYLFRE